MTPEELDRILATEETVEPSSLFARNVMVAVCREAVEPPRLRFPWSRFAIGAAASAGAAAAGTVLLSGPGTAVVSAAASVAPELSCAFAAALIGLGIAAVPRVLPRSY